MALGEEDEGSVSIGIGEGRGWREDLKSEIEGESDNSRIESCFDVGPPERFG